MVCRMTVWASGVLQWYVNLYIAWFFDINIGGYIDFVNLNIGVLYYSFNSNIWVIRWFFDVNIGVHGTPILLILILEDCNDSMILLLKFYIYSFDINIRVVHWFIYFNIRVLYWFFDLNIGVLLYWRFNLKPLMQRIEMEIFSGR